MKVTAFNKYTGEKIYEIELKECGVEHITDVSRNVRLGECWAYINEIPIRREYENENDEFIAGVGAGIAAAAHSGYRPFDIGDYVVYQRNGERQLGRVAGFDNYDREKVFICFNKGCTASATNIADLFPATVTEQTRAVQEGRLFGYHRFDAMGIERASDRWQVRAIERDTGKLIVFPHVFDDPDEAARQFAKVCRSPHYRSVDIALVLD